MSGEDLTTDKENLGQQHEGECDEMPTVSGNEIREKEASTVNVSENVQLQYLEGWRLYTITLAFV